MEGVEVRYWKVLLLSGKFEFSTSLAHFTRRRRKMNHRKLYPPGRIIEVDDRADDVVVGEVQKGRYDCIRLGKEAFDLRWHLPERYERTLRRWKKG